MRSSGHFATLGVQPESLLTMIRFLTTVVGIIWIGANLTQAADKTPANGAANEKITTSTSSAENAQRDATATTDSRRGTGVQQDKDSRKKSGKKSVRRDLASSRHAARQQSDETLPAPKLAPNTEQPETAAPGSVASRRLVEFIQPRYHMRVLVGRHKVMRGRSNVYRTFVADPEVCEIVQYSPRDLSINGLAGGTTEVTFWLRGQSKPVKYRVDVHPRLSTHDSGVSRRAQNAAG